jgi:hypothetical protein
VSDLDSERRLLLGVCGLYCGACYHYRASFPDGQHLLDEAARQGKRREGYTCRGCRSDTLYIHPGCAQCEIRACADGKGVLHCGDCDEFPCERLEAFRDDGRVHHLDVVANLEDLGAEGADQWLEEQERRWTCGCGARFSWYETACHRCGEPLASYGPDPTRA